MRRLLGALTLVALLATTVSPAAAREPLQRGGLTAASGLQTAGTFFNGSKSQSGGIAQSDANLLSRTDRAVVNIIVKVDADALASYTGGVGNLAATSPAITGRPLRDGGAAISAYQRYLTRELANIQRDAKSAVPAVKIGRSFLVAFGGFAAQVPANKAKNLLGVRGVVAVMYDTVNHPTANDSPNFVGAPAVWSTLGGESTAGAGVKVAVLDTGIWPEHPMLLDPGIPAPGGGPYACEFGLSGNPDDPAFVCNDKMLGAYAFMETNMLLNALGTDEYCDGVDTCSARDADGHGTHTSTTAVGSPVDSAVLNGTDYGHISGIAPGASLIHYRVCGASTGCYTTDSMAAIEQAIIDDVDVINFSISGGANAYSDGVELAFLDAYAAGILVNASAGNAGPDAATANHAGGWTNTVGASTLNREFATTLHLTATGGSAPLTMDVPGVTVSGDMVSSPVVLGSATVSGELCDTAAGAGDYTGEIVVCRRGTIARVEKGYNVSLGGAVGMILYNVAQTDLETDNHFLPAVHVNDPTSAIAAWVADHTGVTAYWSNGVPTAAQGDVMASFSSRGPLGDFIKPDVTAPGVQILAGASPKHLFAPADGLGPNDELYQAIAGTSMSSPHAAGVAALLKAAHPSWTPGQIKSAMMTSSVQSGVVKEDGITPADPFDRGAGSIRADRANSPTVTFDVTAPQYYASAGDPFSRINLNLPSINAPNMPGQITTTRTAKNVTGVSQTINISATANIIVTPSTITLGPWGSATFTVKIDGQKLEDGQYFGKITLDPVAAGYRNAVLPVAWDKHPGDVTLVNECDAPVTFVAQNMTINKGETAPCSVTVTNYASTEANVQVRVKAPNTGRLIIQNWTAGNKKGNGFLWNGVLGPALPPPVDDLVAPGDGFFDLSLYIDPESAFGVDLGDEGIQNYDIPGGLDIGMVYGDVVYETFGVTSNGYVVMGGGDSQDISYIPQDMPDPARPNNVLAPYWTDLNFDDGGELYVGLLDDGYWYLGWLIQWEAVPLYGSGGTETRSFEVFIATEYGRDTYFGGDYITFEYDSSDIGPGTADGLNVGAEDFLGISAAQTGVDTTETFVPDTTTACLYPPYDPCGGYYVDTGTTIEGGSMTVDYDAFGKKTGTFDVKAMMTSDVTQGTDYQIVRIKVVNP